VEQDLKSNRTSSRQTRLRRTLLVSFPIMFLLLAAIVALKWLTGRELDELFELWIRESRL
jgi:hypothetical protein